MCPVSRIRAPSATQNSDALTGVRCRSPPSVNRGSTALSTAITTQNATSPTRRAARRPWLWSRAMG